MRNVDCSSKTTVSGLSRKQATAGAWNHGWPVRPRIGLPPTNTRQVTFMTAWLNKSWPLIIYPPVRDGSRIFPCLIICSVVSDFLCWLDIWGRRRCTERDFVKTDYQRKSQRHDTTRCFFLTPSTTRLIMFWFGLFVCKITFRQIMIGFR